MRKLLQLFNILGIVILPLIVNAQTPGAIRGRVADAKGPGLNAATISLLRAADSSVLKTSVSDKSGNFIFENTPQGKYLVAVSAVGYSKSYSHLFELGNTTPVLDLPVITIASISKELVAVTITAVKPMIEQKIDKTVLNVDASVTNVGANALEVLEKAPGVQVDKDGNISLKGKQGVMIMLDGRPTYLSSSELANMLRGMQASQLETIEIMTNPPAKYDASGNSGIINIRTKKNKIKGFNGNVSAGYGQGVYAKTNESLSLNYRNGKINLFSNYSFNRNNNFQELDIYRRYKNDDQSTKAIFEQSTLMRRRNLNNNLKIGLDYFLTDKTTLGVVFSGFYNPSSTLGVNTSYLKNPQSITDSIVQANNTMREIWRNASVNLNMRHQFDTTGRELTADLDYVLYGISNAQQFLNTTLTPEWTKKYDERLMGDLPATISIYSAKTDYTHPINKETKLEMGLKSSYVVNDSKANYFTGSLVSADPEEMKWTPDYGKTNFFKYKENINAAYISLSTQLSPKWGLQTGLRYENTNYNGLQYGNPERKDSSFKRSYDGLFPTVYVSFKASKDHQFGISYGRRIDRPNYQNMNPFMFFIDKYTYGVGNPFLRPQYSNNFELTHIFKGFLTTTLNYSATTDLFNEIFDQDSLPGGGKGYGTIVRQGNIGRRQNAGISVNLQLQPVKWFSTNIYTNYNYNKYSGKLYGEDIQVEAGNLMMSINNQFRFDKGWSAELSGWARTKGIEGQIQLEPMGQLGAGVSKQVLDGKGTVKLNVRDIFYTQIPRGQINFKSTEATFTNRRDNRVVNLTLTYRFGKPIKSNNNNGQRRRGASEEQNRVKGGE